MAESRSLYSILGVASDASLEEIESAFRSRRMDLDRRGGDADELSLLRVAYDTLKNAPARRRYDARLAAQAHPAAPVPTPVPAGADMAFSEPRSAGRRLGLPFLILGAVLAYWWLKPAPNAPVQQQLAAAATRPAPAQPAASAEEEAPADIVLPPLPPPPMPARVEPAGEEGVTTTQTTVVYQKPKRQPGFDAQYLAWSAFYVIRPGEVTGSGVMVAPNKILTNCHVLAGAGLSGIAVLHSMTRKPTRVTEYARLDDDDACLLHAPGAGSDVIDWGSSTDLKPGDPTHTLGHPGGSADLTWSTGNFVRRRPAVGRGDDFLLTSNYCRPGSSGGPLFDNEGRLVGVVTAVQRYTTKTREDVFGLCASVTEATARELLRKPLFPIAMAPAAYKQNY